MGLLSFVKDAGEKLFGNATNNVQDAGQDLNERLKAHLAKSGLTGTDNVNVSVNNDTVKVTGEALNQEMKEKMMLVLGNVAGISKVEDNIQVNPSSSAAQQGQDQSQSNAGAQAESRFYTVKSGDTLSAIAKAEYGNANDYMKIFEANKPMLTSPDKIYPGQVLRIPQ